jgi:Peptidase family M23/LGFP repeat
MRIEHRILITALAITGCSDTRDGRSVAWGGPDDALDESSAGEDSTGDPPTIDISGRPNFLLPFPCDADVQTITYVGHNPDDKKMDMRRVGMPTGSPIVAAAAGLVHEQFSPGGIEIRHGDGWFTTYMHMKWHVAVGTWVEQGEVVGEMGNVGSPDYHLHHEQLYAPGQDNAHTSDMVHPVIQGEGPIVLVPNQPFTRKSINCGNGELEPYGAIGAKWQALGGASSVVGKPLLPEFDALFGGRFQDFEHGMIIWHPQRAPAAWAIHGRIFEVYRGSGSEQSWGFPTMDEQAAAMAPDGTSGRYQYFEDGVFLWSEATDAHPVGGAIHDAFVAGGREAELGYPKTDELAEGTDGRRQEFQNATIHWNPKDGAWIE